MSTRISNSAWLALIGISMVSFLGCIDFTIVNTALPAMQKYFSVELSKLQWIINAFMLTLSASMVIAGRMADMYGRRKILFLGMLLFALGSLGAGLSTQINILIANRVVQGLGVAILYTVPIAIISELFPEHQRGKATGILIGINGFGLAIGPVMGGFIVSALSWHWIFFINLPITIIGFILCFKTLPKETMPQQQHQIDWLGLALLVLFMPLLVWGVIDKSMIAIAIAVLGLALFFIVEHKTQEPLLDLKLFHNASFITAIIANFSLAFYYTVAFFLIPLFLHNVKLLSPYQIGLTILPATLMLMILSPIVGKLVDKHGPKLVLLIGFACFALSALMQMNFSANTALLYCIASFILFGIGWAFILSPSIVAGISSLPESLSGVGMGAIGTLHNFGGSIGLALGAMIYPISGYYGAMLLLLSLSVAVFIVVSVGLKSNKT